MYSNWVKIYTLPKKNAKKSAAIKTQGSKYGIEIFFLNIMQSNVEKKWTNLQELQYWKNIK